MTLNTLSNGHYDDSFIDQLPRLLPMMSEFNRKLPSLSKAIRRKYFRNVDLDEEDQFRPKYVEASVIDDILAVIKIIVTCYLRFRP